MQAKLDLACEPARKLNPKELAGSRKPATWSVMPRWVVLQVGWVMSVGAAKYRAFNYGESPISASVYQDAMERRAQLCFDGEDNGPETGVSHLASVMVSATLLMDAHATGKLVDDRQKTGLVRPQLEALESLLVTLPLPIKHEKKPLACTAGGSSSSSGVSKISRYGGMKIQGDM